MNNPDIQAIEWVSHISTDPFFLIIKGPTNITQEDILNIHNFNNYMSIHLNLLHNNIPEIMQSLEEYQNAEVKTNEERKELNLSTGV